jgi:hypothetical protein
MNPALEALLPMPIAIVTTRGREIPGVWAKALIEFRILKIAVASMIQLDGPDGKQVHCKAIIQSLSCKFQTIFQKQSKETKGVNTIVELVCVRRCSISPKDVRPWTSHEWLFRGRQ